MKKHVYALLAAASLFANAPAQAATFSGNVVIKIYGKLNTPVSNPGVSSQASCTGYLSVVPTTVSGTITSIGLLSLFAGGAQSASANATFTDASNFTCFVTVPYRFDNVNSATQQLAIAYKLSATDPAHVDATLPGCNPLPPTWMVTCMNPGTHPGRKQQLIQVAPMPTIFTTTVSVNARL